MSYDIEIIDPNTRERIEFDEPLDIRGGTYQLGGTTTAWLNITYNYSPFFCDIFGENGIRTIYGMNVRESMPLLLDAMLNLKGNPAECYWDATEGNARAAIMELMMLGMRALEGEWAGD